MKNLTTGQIIAMILVLLAVIGGGSAQLTDIFGAGVTKILVSLSTLGTGLLSGWMVILTGQGNIVQQVQAMPGIDKIVVNKQANPTLASLVVDEAQPKIEAAPGADQMLAQTAKGA